MRNQSAGRWHSDHGKAVWVWSVILLVLVMVKILPAQELATLPTNHWAYEYLQQLGLRQRLPGTMLLTLPFSYQQIAAMSDSAEPLAHSTAQQFWLQRLRALTATPNALQPRIQAGWRIIEKTGRLNHENVRSRLAVRSHLGIFPDRHLALFNVINMDQELGDDPQYIGKRWRGFTGFSEQAYALLHFDKYLVKFGRDFVWWGRGRDATLLISDHSRPMDHLLAQLDWPRLRLTYLAARLDRMPLPDSLVARYNVDFAERYLAAGRGEFELVKNRLRLAVTQMVLHGGPHHNFEWYYLNPFIFYHGEQLNEKELSKNQGGNTLGVVDFVARLRPRVEFYGQLLVDDVQIEKTRRGDLEPNEIACLVGIEIADPVSLDATTVGLEYTRVANRTYNTLVAWEKFLHRHRPIAHFLGNDFDRWLLHASMYAGANVQLNFTTELLRRGEGRIDSVFDQSFKHYSLAQGYREKFPTGVVEKSWHLRLEARWHPRPGFFLSAHGQYSRYGNFAHRNGAHETDTGFFLRLWWEKDWLIPIGQ
ncbi:MAG: capsule assembly Wzi family protein [candidate division KSB1 bacterium]|nr:capsule assembly Wzi family protein [candidate division KSB1 bacterium]MDZ7310891.1 capsule assembly Wzi family protein [candidate division KSB1 bacterium]